MFAFSLCEHAEGSASGTVVSWGFEVIPYLTPGAKFVSIAAGEHHTLAISSDGSVVAWGGNDEGQSSVPLGLSGVVAIAAGYSHSLALKSDGTVAEWGTYPSGQSTLPPGLSGVVAIAAGYSHSLALKSDGTVVVWGDNSYGQTNVPAGLTGIVDIAAGYDHSLALKSDGTVVAWGDNSWHQTNVPAGLNGVVAIAASWEHSVALKSDGTVVAWGINDYGLASVPPGLSGVKAIAAGGWFNVALKNDGTVVAWGDNTYDQRTVPAGLSGVVAIAAGGFHGLALKSDGTIVAWGNNSCGQAFASSGLDGIVATATGSYACLALKIDGTVVTWGFSDSGQATVPQGLNNVVAIAQGSYHSLALKGDGTVVAWGNNDEGQATIPLGLSGVVGIAAGYEHSLALKNDGTVVAWGLNDNGQSSTPTGLSGVVAIAAGELHSLALKDNGTVVGWGYNDYGQASVPSGLNGVVSIAAGRHHSLAVKSDGTVVAWGYDGDNGTKAGLSNVIAIAAGTYHSLALKGDGTVVAWGYHNSSGAASVPVGLNSVAEISAGFYQSLVVVGASGFKPSRWAVTPNTAMSFGSIQSGSTSERTFTVVNYGDYNLFGTASVSPPFVVASESSYSIPPSKSQTITIRYAPTKLGSDSGYVTFSVGANTITRQVTGSAHSDPTLFTGSISGRVTRSDTGDGVNGAAVSVVGSGGNLVNGGSSPSTITGVIGGVTGSYVIAGLAGNVNYDAVAIPPSPDQHQFYMGEARGVAVVAGQTTSLNISMIPLPASLQSHPVTPKEIPVVLVRGLGPYQTWVVNDSKSEWQYWAAMRSSLQAAGFTDIWDCNQPDDAINNGQGNVINGESGIDDNAFSLQVFVEKKILEYKRDGGCYPAAINIVAHSMGGLISREAICLGGDGVFGFYDPIADQLGTVTVNKVVMLATPNAGTELADFIVDNLGDVPIWTGRKNFLPDWIYVPIWASSWTSTKNITSDYMQRNFNVIQSRFPASVSLYLAGGGGGPTSTDQNLSKGSWIMENLRNNYLPPELNDDGAVTWPSVQGVYYTRIFPSLEVKGFISIPLAPKEPAKWFPELDHNGLKDAQEAIDWTIARLTEEPSSASLAARVANGRESKPSVIQPLDLAPSGSGLQEFALISGVLPSGTGFALPIISDANTTAQFQLIINDTNAVFRLTSPSGATIDCTTPQSDTNVQYSATTDASNVVLATYAISQPPVGKWTVMIDGTHVVATNAGYYLTVLGDSSVVFFSQTGTQFNQGQDVVVSCALDDGSTSPMNPVQNAAITATVEFPDGSTNSMTLFDDGAHNDGAPNDGIYAAIVANGQQAGEYSVLYRCQATNNQGQALQRVATGTFSVSSSDGSLVGDPVYEAVDTNGDGVADFLGVKFWVNAKVAGTYVVSCDLVDSTETNRFSESARVALAASGTTMVPLIFNLAEFPTITGSTNYHVENLQLFEITPTGSDWVDAYHGSSTVTVSSVPSAPIITSGSALPACTAGIPYSTTLQAMGGTTPYTWSILTGSLPTGLSLDSNGTISGTPTDVTTANFVVQAVGNNGFSSTNAFSLNAGFGPPPVASFSAGPTNGVMPLTVSFTNSSTGTITNQAWDFGDGSMSGALNPTHTYSNAGIFTAELMDLGPGSSNEFSMTINVVLPPSPVAGFTAGPTNGIVPLTVNFTNSSSGAITNQSWSFGDGGVSGDLNPTHTYSNLGVFTVSLTVAGPGGSNSLVQSNLVTIPDIESPTLIVRSPTNNATVGSSHLIVSGTATDSGHGNDGVSSVFVNGTTANGGNASGTNTANWSATVTLNPGQNTITVLASDLVNNTTTQQITVIFVVPDTQGPKLTINSPGNATTVLQQAFTVSGTATDSGFGNDGVASVTVNGISATGGVASGIDTANWSAVITLVSGINTITVVAKDDLNNPTRQTRTVTYSPDITHPSVSITSPTAAKGQSGGAAFLAKGTAYDNVDVASVWCEVNGSPWTLASTANNWSNWTAGVTLKSGLNIVQAYAVDTSGNFSLTNGMNFVYVVTALLVVQTNGRGTVSPDYNGQSLAIGSNFSMTATAAAGFKFTDWTGGTNQPFSVLTNKSRLTFRMESNLTLIANFVDTNPPILTVKSPVSGQRWSNAVFTVAGSATDNVAVSNVFYSLNGGEWSNAVTANNWRNWTAAVTLAPGANTNAVYAVDASGNKSPTNKVVFLYIPSAILTVQTNGLGGITPVDNGKLLAVGTNYTLTANPGHNWIFSNWVGGTATPYAVLSSNVAYTFPMQSNLLIEGNFVTNLFLAAQGAYNGLFAPANPPRQQTNSGSFTVSVTSSGVLSGNFFLGSETIPLINGQFDVGGAAQVHSTRHGGNPLTASLQLDLADRSLHGTVSDGSFVAMLHGAQSVFSSTHKATNYQGQYTLIIPGTNDPTVGPFGSSYGTVTVDASGNIAFGGGLADGTTSVSRSSVVSKDGFWPFYMPLYGGAGSLWGWNYFTNQTIVSAPSLSWINATNSSKTAVYRSGFTNQQTTVIGSLYTATNKPLLSLTNAQVILEGGNLPFSIINQITWASNNTITVLHTAQNTNGLTLRITPSGLITGSFLNPTNAKQTITVNGVLLQNQTNAAGYFLSPNQSGAFILQPQ